jgi:hypothetical protein
MSKNNEDTRLPKPEIIIPVEINTANTVLPMNYQALEYVSWFMTDSQNVQNWAGNIFRGGIDTSDPRLVELLAAANKSIQETQDDIAKLKEYLAKIIPVNSNKERTL